MWKNGIQSVSQNGIIGSPFGATSEIGEACLVAITDLLVDTFQEKRSIGF
jgi:creatinine amidohydrolase